MLKQKDWKQLEKQHEFIGLVQDVMDHFEHNPMVHYQSIYNEKFFLVDVFPL